MRGFQALGKPRCFWERIVTSTMAVRVAAGGTPGEPEALALAAAGEDEWEEGNRTGDARG